MSLLDISSMEYFPMGEDIVNLLMERIQNSNAHFFRLQVAHTMAQIASMMRVNVEAPDKSKIPVNMYVVNLSPSGTGKGYSTSILESEITKQFRDNFLSITAPTVAEVNILNMANENARIKGTDPDEEIKKLESEYKAAGPMLYSFDSGTIPAIKQMRSKLLLSTVGSLNLIIDEIGSNLSGNTDLLNIFLELFDMGFLKQKLTKNTKESSRTEDLHGSTPGNILLYGTPTKLLDGGKIEDEFFSFLDTGYARRCFFGFAKTSATARSSLTADQLYDLLNNSTSRLTATQIADHFGALADISKAGYTLQMHRPVAVALLKYRMQCETAADSLSEFNELRKAEISHRYSKVLKLAGAYAFVDGSPNVEMMHLEAAIKLAEDSGQEFEAMLNRERPYVRLCKYIAETSKPLTQADLTEDLPCYRGSVQQKQEMLTLAIAWGYQNHIVLTKEFQNGIEFFSGKSLEKTDPEKLIMSWSTDIADNYVNDLAPFSKLEKLTQKNGMNWCNHHTINGHRSIDTMMTSFNTIVLDVEDSVTIDVAMDLLKEYTAHFYTTKRHQNPGHGDRFRIIMPINYVLSMDNDKFSELMNNIYEWLPFKVDTGAKDSSRKWSSWNGTFYSVQGKLLDIFPFIPNTSKNAEFKHQQQQLISLDALERWFVQNMQVGSRNKMLLRYALTLVSQGNYDYNTIRGKVQELNQKIPNRLDIDEVNNTILKTVRSRMGVE